jgi:hypothetical protein
MMLARRRLHRSTAATCMLLPWMPCAGISVCMMWCMFINENASQACSAHPSCDEHEAQQMAIVGSMFYFAAWPLGCI